MHLPVELRLTIYGFIPVQRKDLVCSMQNCSISPVASSLTAVTMSWYHTSFQILRTSRTIYKEAKAVMAKKRHQIQIAVPWISIERSMDSKIHQSKGLLTLVTHWYQRLRETNGNADFDHWLTEQASRASEWPMPSLPEAMMMFIRQAGYQMLGRMQLLEALCYYDATAMPSMFFRFQVRDSTLPELDISDEEHPSRNWGRYYSKQLYAFRYDMPLQLKNFQIETLANKGNCVECILIWRVQVKTEEQSRVRVVPAGRENLWDYLNLEERWPPVVKGDRKEIVDDPFDDCWAI